VPSRFANFFIHKEVIICIKYLPGGIAGPPVLSSAVPPPPFL
jgi:hypothetical protein